MFLLLAGAGIVSPVPEEITLITAGYFGALHLIDPIRAVPLAIVGLLIGDSILFFLGKSGSGYAKRIHLRFAERGLERTWIFSPDRPLRAVFILRFMTGIRMIAPIFAGLNNASWAGFLLTDFVALVIYVPLLFFLGFHFHNNILSFLATFEVIRHIVFWSVIAIVGGGILAALSPRLHGFIQRVRGKKVEPADTPHEPAE